MIHYFSIEIFLKNVKILTGGTPEVKHSNLLEIYSHLFKCTYKTSLPRLSEGEGISGEWMWEAAIVDLLEALISLSDQPESETVP